MAVLLLFLGLAAITAGAELLVRGASLLALRLGVSGLFVGLTIVGFGTSTPELGASVAATLAGSSEVSVGNVVGSNLFNVGAILGLTALVEPITVRITLVRRELLVALAAAGAPLAALAFGGTLPRPYGGLLVLALLVYLVSSWRAAKRAAADEAALAGEEVRSTFSLPEPESAPHPFGGAVLQIVLVGAGLALLLAGSRLFVSNALDLARAAGVPEVVLGLTLVAAGTSLPELVTSLVAARRGNADIAIGNVIGSNLFNALGILGTATLVGPQTVPRSVLLVDVPLMILATAALLPIVHSGGRISRAEGALLCAGYVVYLGSLALRAG